MADLQTTSEGNLTWGVGVAEGVGGAEGKGCVCGYYITPYAGTNVQQLLKLLEVLDTHSFLTSHSYNPLTTLYSRVSALQKSSERPLSNDMLVMLLCQWAVTPHRSGVHRGLVVARLLRQRQDQIIRVGGGGWGKGAGYHWSGAGGGTSVQTGGVSLLQGVTPTLCFRVLTGRTSLTKPPWMRRGRSLGTAT